MTAVKKDSLSHIAGFEFAQMDAASSRYVASMSRGGAHGRFMDDPFLNYFALFLLLFVVVVLFYGLIAIHDIPHLIAEKRHHPHQDAIYAAGWVSMFTLHALWPFLWIWAMAYRPDRGWGFSVQPETAGAGAAVTASEIEDLRRRVSELEGRASTEDR